MVRIEQEQNIGILRQIALRLQQEADLLIERIKGLTRELARLKGEKVAKAQTVLDLFKGLPACRERALLGDSSEKRRSAVERAEFIPSALQRGRGLRPQPELPIIEQEHELPETERECPVCRGTVTEMGDQCEESEEITIVERRFVVVKQTGVFLLAQSPSGPLQWRKDTDYI
jgi:transposase